MQIPANTIVPAEVEKFDRIGEDWWNTRGSMRALHRLNPARVSWVARVINVELELSNELKAGQRPGVDLTGISILDVGCGGGILSEALARLGANVTGIDPSEGNIAIARRHAEATGLMIDYRATTAEALASSGARFDVVCALEVIEHVADAPGFVRAAGALARPGGLFFGATLNRTFKSFALAVVGAEYVLRWVPQGTHHWEKFVTPREFEEMLEAASLDPVARTGFVYEPLRDRWRESRDMAINYMMAAVRRPS